MIYGFRFLKFEIKGVDFGYDCVYDLDTSVYRLLDGSFEVSNWCWGLGVCLGLFRGVLVQEITEEKPRILVSHRGVAARG